MYSPEIISDLEERIRWNEALDSDFPIELSGINETGTSGKHFQSFHQLVDIAYIYDALPEIDMDEDDFNAVLTDIRKQAVLQVLTDIIDKHPSSLPATDYSSLILSNVFLFDNAIGQRVVIAVLELFMSTSRTNIVERNAKLAMNSLKLELEGFKNDGGHVVAVGVRRYYSDAVKDAAKKLFPKRIIVQSINDRW